MDAILKLNHFFCEMQIRRPHPWHIATHDAVSSKCDIWLVSNVLAKIVIQTCNTVPVISRELEIPVKVVVTADLAKLLAFFGAPCRPRDVRHLHTPDVLDVTRCG